LLAAVLIVTATGIVTVNVASAEPLAFILAGQSNAEGTGVAEQPEDLKEVPKKVHSLAAVNVEVQFKDMATPGQTKSRSNR
jgi:hypothetical protein